MKALNGVKLFVTLIGTSVLSLPLAVSAGDCQKDMYRGQAASAPHAMHPHRAANRQAGYYGAKPQHAVYRYTGGAYHSGGHAMSGYGSKHAMDGGKPDIVDTAAQAGSFNTLIAALEAAGLDEVLRGEGPFTVFAPTDEAFAAVPDADLNALLADKAALTDVLTYHVVPGRVSSSEVSKLSSAETVQGSSVSIDARDGVRVDGAKVVKADIGARNGIIHVIDKVIMPN